MALKSVKRLLQTKAYNIIIIRLWLQKTPRELITDPAIFNMLQFRIIHSELSDATQQKKIYSGCPQGGVVSPLLWNMVVN